MTLVSENTKSPTAIDLLTAIPSLVKDHSSAEALEQSHQVKALLPKNIYVVALCLQLEKLVQAENANKPEQGPLRDSVQPLVTRALEATQSPTKAPAAAPAAPHRSGDSQKRKALEQVKTQYFNFADHMIKKGDFENAITEIRRVLVIDPSDEQAQSYIKKVEELLTLQRDMKPANRADMANDESSQTQPHAKHPGQNFAPSASLDDLVTMTKPDFDAIISKSGNPGTQQVSIDPTPTRLGLHWEEPVKEKRKRRTSFLLGSAFFIFLAIVASYFITTSSTPETTRVQQQDSVSTIPDGTKSNGAIRTASKNSSASSDSLQSQH